MHLQTKYMQIIFPPYNTKKMPHFTTFIIFLFIATSFKLTLCQKQNQAHDVIEMARAELVKVTSSARVELNTLRDDQEMSYVGSVYSDCVKMYEDSEERLARVGSREARFGGEDAVTWLSAVLANYRSCVDGLEERGYVMEQSWASVGHNFSGLIGEALAFYSRPNSKLRNKRIGARGKGRTAPTQHVGLLGTWEASKSKADFVIAQDGSGNYKTINEALKALGLGSNREERVVMYVKSGVYNEIVEIRREMKNVMFVGDGMGRTVVTGSRNYVDGASTMNSATFGVFGDGFWARDMTFENTAGPHKHQAVALRVSSDLSVFYRCSIKGYQDTLLTHSLRQFYRDCHIYGTQDFIFGDAPVVLQNCDIFVRRPMGHQSNMITAQGRDNPNQNTGISIIHSRVQPAPELAPVKSQFKTFLGRPWKKYSRTVFIKTDLDGLVHPRGWSEWSGDFALSTLYYGEHMNTGEGAKTDGRVRWPGFHVIVDPREASPFSVRNFIQGDRWIPSCGVPFWADI